MYSSCVYSLLYQGEEGKEKEKRVLKKRKKGEENNEREKLKLNKIPERERR